MTDETKLIHELILENAKLKAALEAALACKINPCGKCARMERHDCYTLFRCGLTGRIVNPDSDTCREWKERADNA